MQLGGGGWLAFALELELKLELQLELELGAWSPSTSTHQDACQELPPSINGHQCPSMAHHAAPVSNRSIPAALATACLPLAAATNASQCPSWGKEKQGGVSLRPKAHLVCGVRRSSSSFIISWQTNALMVSRRPGGTGKRHYSYMVYSYRGTRAGHASSLPYAYLPRHRLPINACASSSFYQTRFTLPGVRRTDGLRART